MSTTPIVTENSLEYLVPEHFKKDLGKAKQELLPFMTQSRYNKMLDVVKKRSRQVACVFENTHHAHNISAVLRTIESFGFLDVFFLYNNEDMKFRAHDAIDRGSSQWIFPRHMSETAYIAKLLKQNGYIIALVSKPDFSRTSDFYVNALASFTLNQFASKDFDTFVGDRKIALIFGSELVGISKEWNAYADCYFSIDMYGFCESLNVSVCAAIILNSLRQMHERNNQLKLLSSFEQELILEHWVAKEYAKAYEYMSFRKPELLEWFLFVRSGHFYSI